MQRVVSWFGWFRRGSLLLRFSLLSLLVLALIAFGLATALENEMEQDALHQQADEITVIVQGVAGQSLRATTLTPATSPRARAWWGGLAQQLMQANRASGAHQRLEHAGAGGLLQRARQIGQRSR